MLHAFRQPPNPSTATNNSTRRLPAVEEDSIIPSATGTPTIPTISQEAVGVATNLPMEGESSIQRAHTATLPKHSSSELVSLRTVPVWIKGNGKKVKVNAVLDDASTGTFLNDEIAIALGLQSAYERVTMRVLNETVESFDTMPVEVTLERRSDFDGLKCLRVSHERYWQLSGSELELVQRPMVISLIH